MAGHRRATARLLALREHPEDRSLLDPPPQAAPPAFDGRPRPGPGGAERLARLAAFLTTPGGGLTDDDPEREPGTVPPVGQAAAKGRAP